MSIKRGREEGCLLGSFFELALVKGQTTGCCWKKKGSHEALLGRRGVEAINQSYTGNGGEWALATRTLGKKKERGRRRGKGGGARGKRASGTQK